MSKVYIEYDDHHNEPILETFDTEDEAVESIMRRSSLDEAEIRQELFGEDGLGEVNDCDTWSLVTFSDAEARAQYWQNVADSIHADRKAPV